MGTPLESFHSLLLKMRKQRAKQRRSKSGTKSPSSPPSSPDDVVPSPQPGECVVDAFVKVAIARWPLPCLRGHLLAFASDQTGSRFLQAHLDAASASQRDAVLTELSPHVLTLMEHTFGNYVAQKMLEVGDEAVVRTFMSQVLGSGQATELIHHQYACRVIQKAFEVAPTDVQETIIQPIKSTEVAKTVADANAHNVVMSIVASAPVNAFQFVVQHFNGRASELALHKSGSRVLLKILQHGSLEQTSPLIAELMEDVCMLASDEFGNFVVQHVLEFGRNEERQLVAAALEGHLVELSFEKFGSNTVEKLVRFSQAETREQIFFEFLQADVDAEGSEARIPALIAMMLHQYGNYVVQRMIECGTAHQREVICSSLSDRSVTHELSKGKYSKHIVAALQVNTASLNETACSA